MRGMLLRLAPLLLLAACATADLAPGPEAPLPPTAHEWDHGPPWTEAEAPWAAPPDWAALPPSSWAWGGPALGPWVGAPVVGIGVGSGWWWGYRPWPRFGGWWSTGPAWGGYPGRYHAYRWAYRPYAFGAHRSFGGFYGGGYRGYYRGGFGGGYRGGHGGFRGGRGRR